MTMRERQGDNIILIGSMGTGKNVVGRDFADTEDLPEQEVADEIQEFLSREVLL